MLGSAAQVGFRAIGKQLGHPVLEQLQSGAIATITKRGRHRAKLLKGFIQGARGKEQFGVLSAGGRRDSVDGKHQLEHLDRFLRVVFLLKLRCHLRVLCQGVAGQPLPVVQGRQGEGNRSILGHQTLDLLVYRDRLQEVGVLGIVLADVLVLYDRLVLPVVSHQQLGKPLPMPDLLGVEDHNLLVVLDRLVELALQHEALGTFQYFVFFRSQLHRPVSRRNIQC